MTNSEKFCLRWNDFETNISTAFRELRDDKDFFDVTIACDGNQLQAHKVILSACSPFFKSVLKKNPHQHPLLYLKGVKHEDILSVLNFMYHGEVNVAQEGLNSFLAVAEDLQVKGLTQTGQKQQPISQNMPSAKIFPQEKSQAPITMPSQTRPNKPSRIRTSYEHAIASSSYDKEVEDFSPLIKTEAPLVDVTCDPQLSTDQQIVEHSDEYAAEQDGYDYQQEYNQDQDSSYHEPMGHGGDTSQGT